MPIGNCYRCGQTGHWVRECPQKSNAGDPPPSIHCPCGGGVCLIKTSNTPKNPGRKFNICPAAQSCNFFKWCDDVTDEDLKFRPAFRIPNCPCGSGPCRRVKVDSGPDSGRAYLVCSVKKGFGACGFFQWEGDVDVMEDVVDVMDDVDFWEEADLVSSRVENTFYGYNVQENDMVVSGKHSAVAAVNQGSSGIRIVPEEQVPVMIQPEELLVQNVHCDQPTVCGLSNSGLKESCQLNVDEVMHDLVIDTVSSGASVVTNHGDQATICALSKSSFEDSLQLNVAEVMNDVVRDMVSSGSAVTKYGDQVTNCDLSKVNLKESFQLNVDQAMSDLIRDTVPSSGSGLTNHEQHVAGTGEAEWSLPNLQDLMKQYNSEKLHLESVSGKHVQVLNAFMGSYRRLRLLHEKTFQLRKELLEAEEEMACCEAETLEFGVSCREVAGEMAESQKRMQEIAEKLGKEVEVLKQKEFVPMKRQRS